MEEDNDNLFAAATGWGEDPFSFPAATNTEEQTGEGNSFGVLSRGELFGSGSTSFDGGGDRGGGWNSLLQVFRASQSLE